MSIVRETPGDVHVLERDGRLGIATVPKSTAAVLNEAPAEGFEVTGIHAPAADGPSRR